MTRRTSAAWVLAVALSSVGCGRAEVTTTAATAAAEPLPPAPPEAAAPPVAVAEPPPPAVDQATLRRGVVILVPLRSFPDALLDEVQTTLEREFSVEVRRHAVAPLPEAAYYAPRRRYRADVLIDHLLTFAEGEPATTRVLGLTEVDISTTNGKYKDWGIFGLGYTPGQSAVVSSFRLARKASAAKLRRRVGVTALHEVGHTFGLEHCAEARCFMQDAEGSIANTDTSTGQLGAECQTELDTLAPRRAP